MAFACHGCGDCCKGSTVLLSPFDLARLSATTGEPPRAVIKERCVLLKHPQTNLPALMLETVPKCSYLDDGNRCTVYSGRPLVCRGYPLGVLADLNERAWPRALDRFSLRPNPCPPPTGAGAPLPIVRTLHEVATGASMESFAEAFRVWARFTWDVATRSRYPHMAIGEAHAFDREFIRTFFEEVEAPADEGRALAAFVRRVLAFREHHALPPAPAPAVNTPPAATGA